MFRKSLKKGVAIVKVLSDCYGKIYSVVRWKDASSSFVCVRSGIREGTILSPLLFELGCFLGDVDCGCVCLSCCGVSVSEQFLNGTSARYNDTVPYE